MNIGDVFVEHARSVYSWAYRLLGRHHDAQDVVQDVYLRWDRQCRIHPPESAQGWLRRVTINAAIDHRRARPTVVSGDRLARMAADTEVSTIDPLETAEARERISDCLADLSEMQRAVLTAKIFDELTFAQVAAELGISVPTAKTHYLRAVTALRDCLGKQPVKTETARLAERSTQAHPSKSRKGE